MISSLRRSAALDLPTCTSAALTLGTAYALKLAYSHAGANQLAWILAPSCWFAEWLGGLGLRYEAGAGWITHQPRMVVGPACAGVNFLVVSWLALFFSQQARWSGLGRKLLSALGCLGVAYLLTVLTNGLRIVLAAQLYAADIYTGWLTRERLHRALGVVLYCSVLFALCRASGLRSRKAWHSDLAPFAWYLAVALGIPLANRAYVRDPAHFVEHAALTLALSLAVLFAFQLITRVYDRLSSGATRP